MVLVRSQGNILVNALPQESVPANIARRVLKIIREEYNSAQERVRNSFFKPFFFLISKIPRRSHEFCDDSLASLHKLVTQTSETEKSSSLGSFTRN